MRWYLRIAVSALCLVVCLLLIALWVRSYTWRDEFGLLFSGNERLALLQSLPGRLAAGIHHADGDTFHQEHYSRLFNTEQQVKTPRTLTFRSIVARFKVEPQWQTIHLPYWLLMGIGGALAALPWLQWRFSLRPLLVAMTLVAFVLGMAM